MPKRVLKGLILGCLLAACASTPKQIASDSGSPGASGTAHEVSQSQRPAGAKLLALPEIVKRMEASSVQYRVAGIEEYKDAAPEQLIEKVWPWGPDPIDFPAVVTGPDGRRSVLPYPGDPEVVALLEQA